MIPLLSVTWFILARFLYSYMSFLYFTWSCNLLKLHSATSRKVITTKLGGNIYKNEILTYLHMMWPNHAKRKLQLLNLRFDERYPSQQATWFLIILYPEKWKEHMELLQKLLDIKFDIKTQKIIYLFFRCKTSMINAASWKELKLLGC